MKKNAATAPRQAKAPACRTADMKTITARVPPEVHRALRIRAAEEGRSVAVIVEGLVREYLVGRGTA